MAYSEALGVAREFAEQHGYEVDPNQELKAHAFTNLASGLFAGLGGYHAARTEADEILDAQLAQVAQTLLFIVQDQAFDTAGDIGQGIRHDHSLIVYQVGSALGYRGRPDAYIHAAFWRAPISSKKVSSPNTRNTVMVTAPRLY